ncbi:M15 family metallopeptidase [Nocardioides daphniae]|uniref:D-alanyl-D-alanine carboxypeptidase-like core domain-containing protein n=2 Tax=Nocardioides daphniae TaxID=402297 RepID=A0A4P7U9Y2_9ACTN|nr:hypothetical protein E2C04_00360 [Nocardioides daphniae]
MLNAVSTAVDDSRSSRVGQRPQHRALTRHAHRQRAEAPEPDGSNGGRHRATKPSRASSRRTLGTLAALATVGAIGAGIAPGPWLDETSATAQEDSTQSSASPVEEGGSSRTARNRPIPDATVDLSRREPTLSRSATRAESRTTNRMPSWLSTCRTTAQESTTPNGQIPDASLCELPDGFHLRGDAAAAWARLSAAYKSRFEDQPCLTDGYRDLASQQRLYAVKPGLAAQPGTSNHGWGVAVDLCGGVETFGTDQYVWMLENAERFGWENPAWARSGGSRPEPWHWEYIEGTR